MNALYSVIHLSFFVTLWYHPAPQSSYLEPFSISKYITLHFSPPKCWKNIVQFHEIISMHYEKML